MSYTPEIESAFGRLRAATLRGDSEADVAEYHEARDYLARLLKSLGVAEFKQAVDDYVRGRNGR